MGRKDIRRDEAFAHIADTRQRLIHETKQTVSESRIYNPSQIRRLFVPKPRYAFTETKVSNADSVSAVIAAPTDRHVAVLNFASFKNPGGGYANGSMAQEEALCSESNLYDILCEFEDGFYIPNRSNLKRSLYTSHSIYLPDVVFERDKVRCISDVITTAAPNVGAALKHGVSAMECRDALRDRIEAVMKIAADNDVDYLILGAFGCGVFKNNPHTVASMFKAWIDEHPGVFEHVEFAIRGTGKNLDAFTDVFEYR